MLTVKKYLILSLALATLGIFGLNFSSYQRSIDKDERKIDEIAQFLKEHGSDHKVLGQRFANDPNATTAEIYAGINRSLPERERKKIKVYSQMLDLYMTNPEEAAKRLTGNSKASDSEIVEALKKLKPKIWFSMASSSKATSPILTASELRKVYEINSIILENTHNSQRDKHALGKHFVNNPDASWEEIDSAIKQALPEKARDTSYDPLYGASIPTAAEHTAQYFIEQLKIDPALFDKAADKRKVEELRSFIIANDGNRAAFAMRFTNDPNANWRRIFYKVALEMPLPDKQKTTKK